MARCAVSSLFIQHKEPAASLHWLGSLGEVRVAHVANIVAVDSRTCIQLMQIGQGLLRCRGLKMDDRPFSQG
jgi:hypothetical protein